MSTHLLGLHSLCIGRPLPFVFTVNNAKELGRVQLFALNDFIFSQAVMAVVRRLHDHRLPSQFK
jgi:hypothetical protein